MTSRVRATISLTDSLKKTIELLEESSVAVAHWLNAALQTRKVADYERIRGGQSLCHEIAVLRHVLNQVN